MVFRERLSDRLHSWLLPFAAVLEADLASLVRSWVLRAWFVITAVVALVALLGHNGRDAARPSPAESIIHAIMRPTDAAPGDVHTLAELFKSYVVLWTTFVVLLTAGAMTGERDVLADAVLSRGISRWQYFLGKWSARLAAVLGVYLLVMAPTAAVVWVTAPPSEPVAAPIAPAGLDSLQRLATPGTLPAADRLTMCGIAVGLARVAAVLMIVATFGVASSALLDSTILAVGVAWVTSYGAGVALSLLGVPHLSPNSLFHALPELLCGDFRVALEWRIIIASIGTSVAVASVASVLFSHRDV